MDCYISCFQVFDGDKPVFICSKKYEQIITYQGILCPGTKSRMADLTNYHLLIILEIENDVKLLEENICR